MGQVERTVEIRVDRIAPSSKVDENSLLAAITLISLEAGDPVADGLGTIGRTAFSDLSVEGRELAIVEPDGDLCGHAPKRTHAVNHLVCARGRLVHIYRRRIGTQTIFGNP